MIGRSFYYLWRIFDVNRRVLFGLIALVISISFIIGIFSDGDKVKVPEGAALVFAPSGIITEQPAYKDPVAKALEEAMGNKDPKEENIYDLIEVLRNAKDDDRITMIAMYPQGIVSVGPAMLEMLRDAIADFKTSGKKVVSMGDYYSQAQYYLAAQADEVYLHPYGAVFLEGYSRVRTYYAAMLENLKVTPNVFKVGKYKSAIEPYLRDDMSEYAKEANMAFLTDMWTAYKTDVAAARGIDADSIDSQINGFAESMKTSGGDFAKLAVEQKLIDGVMSRPDFRAMMIEKVGENEKKTSYKQINHSQYLKAIKAPFDIENPNTKKVAVIVAKGAIVDGKQKEGMIGGDTVAYKIRQARTNENTAAIVLRVDSPGGSAFASEIIREELIKAKDQGLPLIVSMGTYAASGGYWISANADEIWARPTTITGSIGIFGFIPTIERTLDWAGIHRDGVGTTELAGAFDTGRALSQPIKDIIQANIENGYRRFLNLVATGRDMTVDQVDEIAQGRVWSGLKAKELGLVDNLGSLKDAIASAAKRAELDEGSYDVWFVKRELSETEKFMAELFKNASVQSLIEDIDTPALNTPADKILLQIQTDLQQLKQFNDPNHAYVHCDCLIN